MTQLILQIAQEYFPKIDQDNFVDVFKLTLSQIRSHLQDCDIRTSNSIRNFLMFVYWCRHYPSFRALAALFGLSKSQTCRIIHQLLDLYSQTLPSFINLNNVHVLDPYFLPNVVGIVDCTEILINSWIRESYSGKIGDFSVKYQVVIGFPSLLPIDLHGPFLGKENDASVWKSSSIRTKLNASGYFVLGDKGYVGCDSVYSLRKKRPGQTALSELDKEYNMRIKQVRARVENHFADLKKWSVVSLDFRGDLNHHYKVFVSCEFLTFLAKT